MLYGFSSNKNYDISKSLGEFLSYSKYHPNGWGLASYALKSKKAN